MIEIRKSSYLVRIIRFWNNILHASTIYKKMEEVNNFTVFVIKTRTECKHDNQSSPLLTQQFSTVFFKYVIRF